MSTLTKLLLLSCVMVVLLTTGNVANARKKSRKSRRFCPLSSAGKRRPAVLNVQASFQITKGNAVFRVNTCRDPPVCFLATTRVRSSQNMIESDLWKKLLDALMGKLDIEPAFQYMKLSLKNTTETPSRRKAILYQITPRGFLAAYPFLEKLCQNAIGVYSFVPAKNLTKSRPFGFVAGIKLGEFRIPQLRKKMADLSIYLQCFVFREQKDGKEHTERSAENKTGKLSMTLERLYCCNELYLLFVSTDFASKKIVGNRHLASFSQSWVSGEVGQKQHADEDKEETRTKVVFPNTMAKTFSGKIVHSLRFLYAHLCKKQ